MGTLDEALRGDGIEMSVLEGPALGAGFSRLARIIRELRLGSVGLAPVADDVAVPALALGLARSLSSASNGPVGVLDACGTWPCGRALAGPEHPDDSPVAIHWLRERLAVLTPRSVEPGTVASRLRIVAGDPAAFSHLVVDLTGVDRLGESVAAYQVLDATVVVARSGRTRARQIEHGLRDLPPDRNLGVLLMGT